MYNINIIIKLYDSLQTMVTLTPKKIQKRIVWKYLKRTFYFIFIGNAKRAMWRLFHKTHTYIVIDYSADSNIIRNIVFFSIVTITT